MPTDDIFCPHGWLLNANCADCRLGATLTVGCGTVDAVAARDSIIEALERGLAALRAEEDPVLQAKWALELVEDLRQYQGAFAEVRTGAFRTLRATGWSLKDCAREFGITDARVAQITRK